MSASPVRDLSPAALEALVPELVRLADEAGAAIMDIYSRADLGVVTKADDSPLTAADMAADHILYAGLAALTPDIPVVTEEQVASGSVPDISGGTFWLVDPLDGTKEFIARRGDFTVNIALLSDHWPVLGILGVPARGQLYWGGRGIGAFRRDASGTGPIAARTTIPAQGLTLVGSRMHRDGPSLDHLLSCLPIADHLAVGSAVKFARVAEGAADFYPRFSPTCLWDIAAGHAIVEAAGGVMMRADGGVVSYHRRKGEGTDAFLSDYFVAASRPTASKLQGYLS
jgi:3'(2'), 5'-bisphosphate nucleotidase